MAAAQRGEASCKLVTGSLTLELQQAAGEEEEERGRGGGGGTEQGRPGELLVRGGGGGFTSLEAPGRSSGGVATVTVSSREKQAEQIKNHVVMSRPPAQRRILCYFIQ